MSDSDNIFNPPDPEDQRQILSGEYVLGLLPRDQAQAVSTDPTMSPLIADWEHRLAPLLELADAQQPPADLWPRIAASAGLTEVIRLVPSAGRAQDIMLKRRLAFWQTATAGMSAIAAVLVGILLYQGSIDRSRARFIAPLSATGATEPSLVASVSSSGTLRITSLGHITAPEGRDLELWVLPKGETVPRSLGILPPSGSVVLAQKVSASSAQFMVSDEPRGGSPTGKPTGKVLFSGALAPVSG